MKLTLKQELRPRPFTSVLGLLDLKTGVTVVVLFAVLNKVAGAQLTLYIYSVLALAGLAWGLHTINDENPKHMLYFAHVFFADHILNTTWTVYFAVNWWLYTPHDGRRNANSPAQQAIIEGYIGEHQDMSPEERTAAAERVWRAEKSQALTIIILGWLIKFYFAALLYSFAHHLRRGTYRPLSFSRNTPLINDSSALPPLDSDSGDGSIEDVDLESFYGVTPTLPVHSIPPPSVVSGISGNSASSHRSRGSGSGSAGSFADFVSAPPPKRVRPTRGSLLAGGARRSGSGPGSAAGSSAGPSEGEDDEVSSAGTGPGRVRA
ncbi:Inositolphosphorylceramide synthase subunit Kei1-domain-containing protein [Lactarius akahatsu]|uniref:Inositolphosphorylceramide synthase subunit Kei1-domain-containing protein n=1 Tax=Lactarius akahatsu TaxID=416441 RepID=A0AAD4QB29_9AGAM|nr:Inositolphosphorylceramide synthase subunit Kei1-domain-containing protein [Lactarius akahatsu]